ncbi:hypothetical protein Sfum_2046 [Syntrophobacter fumaroxidans MPOB]|uniref:Uncharacterized protein n=1 Tax=Syntrophobacter fumaroxidans (strain DSM 10017 / MPOB) TaxID=335543 RepID=A0LJX7_SYNFM|nr:hypothetical protein Sfum_2046 [Syntrophobacter fumaroxidans MPOB]
MRVHEARPDRGHGGTVPTLRMSFVAALRRGLRPRCVENADTGPQPCRKSSRIGPHLDFLVPQACPFIENRAPDELKYLGIDTGIGECPELSGFILPDSHSPRFVKYRHASFPPFVVREKARRPSGRTSTKKKRIGVFGIITNRMPPASGNQPARSPHSPTRGGARRLKSAGGAAD